MRITIPILLTAFFISTSCLLFAQSISINAAKEIAKNHLQAVSKGNLKSAGPSRTKFQFSTAATATENNDTLYFVLNDSINKSFVIVSADKRAYPILGYSLEGNFDEANQPPAFVEWMEYRKQEIAYIKKNNLQADSKTTQQWDNLSSAINSETATTVGPLLQTTWNQSQYYNDKCPADINSPYGYNGHVPTGCTATAMAQVMKFWNYPNTGTGSKTYTPLKHPEYGSLTANFGATTYLWDQMPNNVTSQNDAVATLMFHCGVSVEMDYGPDGSGGPPPITALVDYFKYSSDARYVEKDDYSSSAWLNLLKFELDSHRPIWYDGFNSNYSTGHAFVLNGYDANDKFYINWGWGGSYNGYYLISNLIPIPPDYDFRYHQAAIIKVFPAKVPDAIGSITGLTEVCAGQTAVTYSVPAIQNAASYTWTLPTGATGTSTTNSITVTFGANSGTIKVKAQNSLGTTAESSLAVTVNAMPSTPGAITGKSIVCPSVSETYSIAAVSGAVSYTWELPTGWTGSSTSTSITVTTGSAGGTIKVKANNAKCSGTSSSLVVSTGTPISPTSVSASLTTVTPGQSTTLQVNGGALNSAPNWIWYTGSCGGTQVGTGSTLTVSPTATTTYYVQATGCGISTTCKSITITYCSAPAAPASSSASIGSPANGTSHKINFSVSTVTGADGYMWDYSLDGVNWVANWYDTSCSGTCYSYTGFGDKPNVPIYFRVRAYKCSPKQYSNYTYTLPTPIYTACDVPASPTVNGATSSSLNLTLNTETPVANPAITTYSIYCTTTSQYLQTNGTLGSTEVFQTKSAWGTKTVTGLTGNTQYCFYAKAKNNDGDIRYSATNATCGTTVCTAPVTPTSATASLTTISAGQSTTLQVNGGTLNSAPNWVWYSGSCGGTQIGTGTTLSVSPTSTTTYYVKATACGTSTTCKSVTVTVCTAPVSPTSATATSTTISSGQSTTLQVNGGTLNSAPGWIWYSGSCGGTQVGTGASLVVSPTVTTTYYVQATACGTSTTCKSVTITVSPTSCVAPSAPATCSTSIGNPANGLEHTTNLSCSTVSGADGYFFEYSFDGILWETDWGGDPGYSWQINLHDSPNIPIYYRVRAYKCTPALYSNYTYASPKPIYTACDVPAAPTVNQATSNSLSISLNAETPVANPAITTYSIYCTTTSQYVQANGTLGNTEVFQTKSTWGTKTITGLLANTQYCFYAKAKNNDGDIRFNSLNSACGTTVNGSPTASFSANQVDGCSPLIVNFTDASSGTPTSWAWDIDNNGSVDYTIKNPTHTYTNAGNYTVKLTVTNGSGSSTMTRTNYITVNSTKIAGVTISASPSSTITPGQLVTFTATPSNGGTNPTYQWKVQGGNVGTNSPTYSTSTLTNGQVVTCVMSSSLPCASPVLAISNSITMSVGVACTSPVITSSPDNQYKTAPESASFSVTASGSNNLYQWQYNKGNGWANVPADFQHSGVSTSKLNLSSTSVGMSGYQYRCFVSSSCNNNTAISSSATLVVYSLNGPTLTVTPPAIPIPSVFTIGLKFNVPVSNVPNGITVVGGKLENISGSGDTYTLTVSAEEQTTVSIVLSDAIRDTSPNMNKFAGQTLTYTIGDFTKPQMIYWTPNNETILNNHPLLKITFNENIILGAGGNLKIYKVATTVPVLTIPVTSAMISEKNLTVTYSAMQNGLNKNTYYFVLFDGSILTDNAGNSFDGITDFSTWTFKTGAVFATGNEFNEIDLSNIKVYPNPTSGIINIEGLPVNQKSKISVFAANGDLIIEKTIDSDKDKIDISKQVPGTYFLQINKQSIKIIKE